MQGKIHDVAQLKKKVENATEWSPTGRPVSPVVDCYVSQVTSDRHQATARNMKLKTAIATKNSTKGKVRQHQEEIKGR